MLVLVPVKARNSIDITSTRETTKTRAMTTPSNSLKLPFTDVIDCSLGTDRATPRPLWHEIRSTEIDRGFLKSPPYGRLRMPQSSQCDIATGESAQGDE
jgi:hypothetical protein